ncbi:type I restriction-modification system subunit M N-terminal domain-containing protein [Thiolapillus sp.]|uniref:type I restriction-modification system subunit M N-terminal domain-containing protein n=1 Tax=Thiolapillus sp. TaxID=2017437 RepID=UPI003AF47890
MTNQEFKDTLWEAANALRGSVSAAEYKYPVLGLIFLKYVSDLFEAQADVIRQRLADPKSNLYIEDEEIREKNEDSFIIGETNTKTKVKPCQQIPPTLKTGQHRTSWPW